MSANFRRDFSFFGILGASLFVLFLLNQTPRTDAIPAFARKYQTACSTCHNNYPELNDFGEAFKKNGFKFPKDDETFVKEAPVMLGAKAQKEAFPKAVYPGEIPGTIPIGFRYSGFATINSKQPIDLGFVPRSDLFTPNTFTVIAAGSFGPNMSFWIDDDISTGGSGADGGLGDGYLKFNDLGHYLGLPKDALNVRFGQFELDLPFTQARTINLSDYDIFDQTSNIGSLPGSTMNPLTLGAPQRGIEIGGYPNDGNFEWSATILNGNNDGTAVRNSKDVYFRVSQRFNLDRDAASRKEIRASGPTGPHDHTSVRFGAFYYYGRNALNLDQTAFPGFGTINEPFYRAGADFRFKYQKFELYALGMHARDNNLFPNPATTTLDRAAPVTYSGGFAEAEYWIYPWVIGLMRYDVVNSPTDFLNGASEHNTRSRFSPGIQFLIRDNIKAAFEYSYRWQQPDPNTSEFFRANGFTAGIDYVF
ncbi:MAG TPA: hypothetical protein VKV95_09965 [Terriglobia bacterium]|nr:hypothetical protein [Terriglobia bacterium]